METSKDAPPFAVWLSEQRGGKTHRELSAAMEELTEAVVATGKAGTVTLEVKLSPASDANTSALIATDKVKVKLPEPKREGSIFFVDHAGHLTRRDPNQLSLEDFEDDEATEESHDG